MENCCSCCKIAAGILIVWGLGDVQGRVTVGFTGTKVAGEGGREREREIRARELREERGECARGREGFP